MLPFIEKRHSAFVDREHRAVVCLPMGEGQWTNLGFGHLGKIVRGLRPGGQTIFSR